ncbi:portal vertex protein [Klebsiella phage vB_Kpn_3]|nr:portal vertex protein [Klebsiella phage vB_Kpn_3]
MAKNTISYTTGKTADEQANTLTKTEMANVLAILLDMQGFEGQLMKMSIPAMKKMYDSLNKNAMAFNLAKQEARFAKEHQQTAERRAETFERELKREKAKKK